VRRRGRSLEDDRARITGTGFAPPGPCGRARGRDDGRILVTVVSTSRLPVVSEMSRARWPSSPTSRSCGCLHRGSNAQAVSKTGEAARSPGGHTCVDGGLVSLGGEEVGDEVDHGVDRLARILVPRRVHCDVCAWRVVCVRSGVCCGGAIVLSSRGGGAKRAGLGRRSHLELKRRPHLELKGVDLRFVERRQQGDDEW
jgi:hypothetical protein